MKTCKEAACKKVIRLQKENEELRDLLDPKKHTSNTAVLFSNCEALKERVSGLEKLLSEQYPDLKQSLDWADKREKELIDQVNNLEEENIKLKEIISEFIRISTASVEEFEPEFSELIGDAEILLSVSN